MTNRNFKHTAVALSAFFGSLTPLLAQQATPEQQAAPAQQAGAASADACQAAPKGGAPQGKHWYYRTDRSVGRKCWYLGDAGMKTTTARAAQPKASPADSKHASQKDLEARAAAPPQPSTKPSSTPEVTTETAPESSEPVTTQATSDGIASAPLLTQRWPEADAFRPSQTTGAAAPLANSQPANPQPANSQAASPASATPPAQPAAAPRASLAPQDLDEIEQLLRRAAREPHPANANSPVDPAARARTRTGPSAAHASTAQRAGSFRPRRT